MSDALFPDLARERARLEHARACRDRMIARLEAVDPAASADEITSEYVEVTVAEALEELRSPGAGDFFGRIDDDHDCWYIGRRHIEDDAHDPVVVDWRAPVAVPFYRATAIDPLGVDFRRRYTFDSGAITAYLDEHLDDPDAGEVAGGIPDPVLAEIGAARTGAMKEIVATIQAEQDVVIRAPIDQVLVVQGGPGTGKTAVALHRAAFLLFEHRARLARDGVLVVGPNRTFLDYVANVLPSLGERAVRQVVVDELCIPRVAVTSVDPPDLARWKGHADRLDELAAAALGAISAPADDIAVPIGARTHVISRSEFAEWVEAAKDGTSPVNDRRQRLRAIARRELLRRTGSDDAWSHAAPLKDAISKAWPTQRPVRLVDQLLPGPSGRRRRWSHADQLLVDEANTILNGTPFTFGHVVVDEAQDHSAVALRVIGRRSPAGSMTLVGDVAQSTTPAGQEHWSRVFGHVAPGGPRASITDLTIGYRVPEPILSAANRLLPLTGVEATPSLSVRAAGRSPAWHRVEETELGVVLGDVVRTIKHRHPLTGIVAPHRLLPLVVDALVAADLRATDHVHELTADEVPVFEPHDVKGLEFDGVVVVNPHEILAAPDDDGADAATEATPRGARLLYVAMTRAVQELAFVTDAPPPPVLA